MALLIDLIRHGETESPGVLLGRTDAPLSDSGWRQMEQQTQGRRWDLVVASPLSRTRIPAERIAAGLELPARIDPDWAEIDFGVWDGRPVAELSADPEIADAMDAFFRSPAAWTPPDGESWQSLQERTGRALDWLAQRKGVERALVITHAGPMRSAVSLACNIPFERLWALRIAYATRLTLRIGLDDSKRLWGEIVEIVQP